MQCFGKFWGLPIIARVCCIRSVARSRIAQVTAVANHVARCWFYSNLFFTTTTHKNKTNNIYIVCFIFMGGCCEKQVRMVNSSGAETGIRSMIFPQASHQPSEWCIRFAQMCRCVFTNRHKAVLFAWLNSMVPLEEPQNHWFILPHSMLLSTKVHH